MSRSTKALFTCVAMLGLTPLLAVCAGERKEDIMLESNLPDIVRQLPGLEEDAQDRLLLQIDTYLQEVDTALIATFSSATSDRDKAVIAYLLGRRRCTQAVGTLSRAITLEIETDRLDKRERRWERYPVVEALISIGSPSIPQMLANIEASEDEKVRELSARVIRYVEGTEIGMMILQKAIERQTDASRRANLEKALAQMK